MSRFTFPLLLFLALASVSGAEEQQKKLIHLGIDTPDITALPNIATELDQTPFDGWVFSVTSDTPRGRERRFDFTWESWGARAYTKNDVQSTVDALKKTEFKQLTDNFIRFVTTPANVDWFDNFDAILANARLAGWIAREGGMKGIVLDPEEYVNPLFDYHKQAYSHEKSYQEYARQVRDRGKQVMQAFQSDYPDITVLLLFGNGYMYSKEWPAMYGGPSFAANSNDPKKMEYFCYGLLAPFLDGMIEAAGPNAVIIDGTEQSYWTLRRKHFIQHRRAFEKHVLPFVADEKRYNEVCELAFGIWADANWSRDLDDRGQNEEKADGSKDFVGWSATNFDRNYWQPEELELSLKNALRETDKYVWLYSERLFYTGSNKNIPSEYEHAIRTARDEAAR